MKSRLGCFSTQAALLLLAVANSGHAFIVPRPANRVSSFRLVADGKDDAPKSSATGALPPSINLEQTDITAAAISGTASVAMMISQENKRILIEELGYRRSDVDRLKFDLAPALVEQRIRCPEEGIPDSWCRPQKELEEENSMMQRLENESKYPLKLPLLGISLILFGKGFSDALITLIKVNIDFPGASLSDEFLGVPVLLIDAVCVLVGAALGWWTWITMK